MFRETFEVVSQLSLGCAQVRVTMAAVYAAELYHHMDSSPIVAALSALLNTFVSHCQSDIQTNETLLLSN